MIDIPSLMEALAERGLSVKEIADIIRGCTVAAPPYDMQATAQNARKLRNSRYYEKRAEAKRLKSSYSPSEGVLNQDQPKASEIVLNTSETVLIKTPLARVEDNLSRLEITGNHTTPNSASAPDLDWPHTDRPGRAYLDRLEEALREAAGAALASEAVAPRVRVLAPILALGRAGKGPPCDLQADVLPSIRARSAKAPPGSVRSWDFYRDACLEARDRRLAGAGPVGEVVSLARGQPPPSLADRIADERKLATDMTMKALGVANG